MANRLSTFSTHSTLNPQRASVIQSTSHQVSTTTLLNAAHTAFANSQPLPLESSTSLVVNTWLSASRPGPDGRIGGTVDTQLARRAWEHARRRAEDGTIVLGSLHHSTPDLLAPFVSALPLSLPATFYTALDVLKPFLHAAQPQNPAAPLYNALATTFGLNAAGEITSATIALSTSGVDVRRGLLELQAGCRAFDVFYYLLNGPSSPQEREYLGLKAADRYSLLKKTGVYDPPSFMPTADDSAAAEDFRNALKSVGIKGQDFRNLLCTVAAILRLGDALGFLVDQEDLEATCEEVEALLELESDVLLKKCVTEEREVLIAALYEALVDWVLRKANQAIKQEMLATRSIGSGSDSDLGVNTPPSGSENETDNASINVIAIPSQVVGKAIGMKSVFDDDQGITLEMKEDGLIVNPVGASVVRETREVITSVEPQLNITTGALGDQTEADAVRRQDALEKIGTETTTDSFLHSLIYPVSGEGIVLGRFGRFNIVDVLASSRVWFHLCLHPSEDLPATIGAQANGPMNWSAGSVSSQIRAWRLPEWANHRNKQHDYTADFDVEEFADRYSRLGCHPGRDGVESFVMERGWSNGEVFIGSERVWMREAQWWEAETMLDMKPLDGVDAGMLGGLAGVEHSFQPPTAPLLENPFYAASQYGESRDDLMARTPRAVSMAPSAMRNAAGGGDYGLGFKGDDKRGFVTYDGEIDPELAENKHIETQTTGPGRRIWVTLTWMCTFWVPSFLLSSVGRMRRPDVRMAWREKVTLMFLIALINAIIVFYIIEFGVLLCPNFDKVWSTDEVSYHKGDTDFWVSYQGKVYDFSHFWQTQHSDVLPQWSTTDGAMEPFAGLDVSNYIIPPLQAACPGLVTTDDSSIRIYPNTSLQYSNAQHIADPELCIYKGSKSCSVSWYAGTFLPRMREYYKGDLVYDTSNVYNQGQTQGRQWFIIDSVVYDLTNYFYTLSLMNNLASFAYFPDSVTQLVQKSPGMDISTQFKQLPNSQDSLVCLSNAFKVGSTDFRKSARCQVNNYILLAFTIILCTVIAVKFLAALQLGSKRRPAQQDKFVICQVPAYTEGEDQLRKGLDSLTALAYDNKRKLICVICDGMIVGGGNDRPTPKIVLDILGVDPKIDPPALPFKSVGVGSEQLNYGKVYSGLYEYEGNVVPYIVVVKVGKESEQSKSKPGNRGKRDSQILLMSFLNRVHHRSPMNPLELEIFHQINNVIGVDPELYEYLFMVDADTKVKEDSLNRLVAACAHDGKVAGICGETSLENEERSWWTMIQVYEYYISHHLAKAFESLFGSVTCLPGCFCMYRLRTADKGRPLIISDKVIGEYSVNNLDTLHKKNLLALGEDRYLTTLMMKHFPGMSYKFIPDAYALTEAPSTWSVLLSQRRRWINSTIHNLAELFWIKDLCGFCCFSLRVVVFIDLFGTIILPATCAYLVYLIYRVASHTGQFPLISLIMLAAVYGLQAIIFIIKRQWQHVGWMIIYLLAYPIYSFVLPVYSFWKQDDFSWGNTRIVIGEKGDKQILAVDNEAFNPRSIPLQRWDDYALANGLAGRRTMPPEQDGSARYEDGPGYEMDEVRSQYTAHPASTVLTGFPQRQSYFAPQRSPSPFNTLTQQGSYHRYADTPTPNEVQLRHMSMGGMSDPYSPLAHPYGSRAQSQDNLLLQTPPLGAYPSRSFLGAGSRPVSTNNLANMAAFTQQGPTEQVITQAIRECLAEVDLDSVTKKQLKALAEQKLQCQLQGDKRAFLDAQIDLELANM